MSCRPLCCDADTMEPNANNNRLYLNFNGNDRLGAAPNDRTYPTTPSTFPQPVFPSSGQPGGMQSQQQHLQQPQQGYNAGYTPQNYFPQGQQYQPQQQQQPYSGQQMNEYANGQPNVYQPRSNTPGTNDPNTGLAHQFSHQNLGGAAVRNAQYQARGPSPSQRPRTAGATGQQSAPNYANYPPVPSQSASPAQTFQTAPERNPDKYGQNANSNQKKCSQLAADFFKDSVKRARERNQR